MAIYYCDECSKMIDDNYFPCVEHPHEVDVFCCEACADLLDQEEDAEFEREKILYDAQHR